MNKPSTSLQVTLREEELSTYFGTTMGAVSDEMRSAALNWRVHCYRDGIRYAGFLQRTGKDLSGMRVLDLACAWGGHALAFAAMGAEVIASDITDHNFGGLAQFIRERRIRMSVFRASCDRLPFRDEIFDIILALDLVEHMARVDDLAREIKRTLKPGGLCVITTPPRLYSFIYGEPHFGIRWSTWLPISMQKWISTELYGYSYPYPVFRQYTSAHGALRPFREQGLAGQGVVLGRIANVLDQWPALRYWGTQLLFSLLLIRKGDNVGKTC